MFLTDGTLAPRFSLTAEESGRKIDLQCATGQFLLIFHGYQTVSIVAKVIRAVREIYPNPNQVLVISVADMRIVPRLLRGTARTFMKNAYKEASREIPPGQDPADHIIILADWNGTLHKVYRVPPTKQQVALVLISDTKAVVGSYFGAQPEKAALDLLANSNLPDNSSS